MTRRHVVLFSAVMTVIIAADQVTKTIVRSAFRVGESQPVIDGVLWLTHVHNRGAAFGVLKGQQWLLVSVAALVLVAIGYVFVRVAPRSPGAVVALALVAAGAAGNLIDRAVFGGVTDFLDLGWFPVFNVADIALDVGVAMLVWWLLFSSEHRAAGSAESATDEALDPSIISEGPGADE